MIQNDTNRKSLVPAAYYRMFAMRFLGWTYKKIADELGYSESHVRRLFSSRGPLRQVWEGWLENARQDTIEQAYVMMLSAILDIVRTRIKNTRYMNASGVASSKLIFQYVFGKPNKLWSDNLAVMKGKAVDSDAVNNNHKVFEFRDKNYRKEVVEKDES